MIEGNLITTKPGIYCFRNKINDKCYIGQSLNLRKRFKSHLDNFINKRFDNPLYRAFAKYGLDNFEYTIIKIIEEILEIEQLKLELDNLEKQYISEYNSYNWGYNQTLGGDGGILGYKFTPEQLQAHSNKHKKIAADGRYKIIIYDVIKNTYFEFVNMIEAGIQLNVNSSGLRSAKNKKRYYLNRYLVGDSIEVIKETIEQLSINKTSISDPNYLLEYYNYLKQFDSISIKQVCEDLNIGKDAVMKRNKKLRELGYTDLPFNSHKTIKYVEMIDTINNSVISYSLKELSEFFGLSTTVMRKQIKRTNLYKKRYKFNIIYECRNLYE